MTNNVNDFANEAVALFRNLGNGKKAAANMLNLMNEMAQKNDSNRLAVLMHRIKKEKNDMQALGAMKTIITSIYIGAKVGQDKMGRTVIKTKDATYDKDAHQRLADGVKDGLSLRDTLAKRVRGEIEKKDKPVADAAKALCKKHDKAYITALIAALQQEVKSL